MQKLANHYVYVICYGICNMTRLHNSCLLNNPFLFSTFQKLKTCDDFAIQLTSRLIRAGTRKPPFKTQLTLFQARNFLYWIGMADVYLILKMKIVSVHSCKKLCIFYLFVFLFSVKNLNNWHCFFRRFARLKENTVKQAKKYSKSVCLSCRNSHDVLQAFCDRSVIWGFGVAVV